jgi:hypothetical protein
MKIAIAILATLVVATGALAQSRGAYYGPFTDAEAQLLSAVWPEIREAADYEDINWSAHGLSRAPGSREVQRAMAANWDEVRQARRFEEVDWTEVTGARDARSRPSASPFTTSGPFNRDESELLSELWPQIREAANFDDINWRAHGLSRAPGTADAQRLMAAHWSEVRQAQRFEDIDWDRVVDERELQTSRQYAGGFGTRSASPFTRDEASAMSQVWGRIREAARFEDIDWRSVGLSGPPGNREARRLMSTYWGQLREAARFEDINWPATAGTRSRG